ncbi:hypothetical protein NFI96_021967, partial [Prochilodus magdalenae]
HEVANWDASGAQSIPDYLSALERECACCEAAAEVRRLSEETARCSAGVGSASSGHTPGVILPNTGAGQREPRRQETDSQTRSWSRIRTARHGAGVMRMRAVFFLLSACASLLLLLSLISVSSACNKALCASDVSKCLLQVGS